jgi:TonB-dependent SusC/RagA subfamily outer membrane receptor
MEKIYPKKRAYALLFHLTQLQKMTALVLAVLLTNPAMLQARDTLIEMRVSIQVYEELVKNVLSELEEKTGLKFFYFSRQVDDERKVSLEVRDTPLYKILNKLFRGTGITYESAGQQILLKKKRPEISFNKATDHVEEEWSTVPENVAPVPELTVTGVVTDEKSQPLPGVNVVEKGTTNGASTDVSGRFSLNVEDEKSVLVFSFIGFATQEFQAGNQTQFSVTLQTDATALEKVVVTGYGGRQRKADVTGALSSISVDEFAEQPVNRVDQILQGRSAGVQVTNVGGAPGGAVRIRVRGANSISRDNNPLYVVDGYIGADFTTINPNDIETIQVLKDAASTAIYGSRGANGVIIITTKKGREGGIQVNYNGEVSVSKEIGRYNTLSPADFATVINERAAATGGSPFFTPEQINEFRITGGTDWQEEVFRQGAAQEHQLGISGGNEKTTFLISANYLDQGGIIRNTDFKRYNIRSNIASQVSEKFSFRLNLNASRLINHNNGLIRGSSNPLVQALAWAPTTPVYDANGDYTRNDPIGSVSGTCQFTLSRFGIFEVDVTFPSRKGQLLAEGQIPVIRFLTAGRFLEIPRR